MSISQTQIAFVGGGNMARSLIAGLVADGYNPTAMRVIDPDADKLQMLEHGYGIVPARSNADALDGADVVVLCVKPQAAPEVCRGLATAIPTRVPLFVSVMAGVTEASLCHWLARAVPLVRAMPNTPAMLQSGAIGLHANSAANAAQRNLAEEILRAVGLTRWVEQETQIDTVTAVSGSGPAYFFLLMEALEQAAVEQGLDPETARLLSIQTALGAARMAVESDDSPRLLRERVTSPGGTTERAIAVFEDAGLQQLVNRAVAAARQRAAELSTMLGENQ